jgi:SpoVK/Ycf46/Vps4 family AAA+-type ATPase
MTELHLFETNHPNKEARTTFNALAGLDAQKERLVDELALLLDRSRLESWKKKHHPTGLAIVDALSKGAPVVMLSGEVGCGKTALATSVATPVAELLDARVTCFETPSNVRGTGLVGDLSNRITTVFTMAKGKLSGAKRYGLLVIDEADDLATSRAQLQAHHEDRAGLNVLVKQIDMLARDAPGLAVILITNRVSVLDPALRRRVALHLAFERPDAAARRAIFARILDGTNPKDRELDELVKNSERADIPYSSSDLVHRVGRLALTQARLQDKPFGARPLLDALADIAPTPLVEEARLT